jgi:outer membrane murein-binding lipoprotein Lpp
MPVLLVVIALLVGVGIGSASSGATKLRTDLAASQSNGADLTSRVSGLNGQVSALNGQVTDLRTQNSTLGAQLSSLASQVSHLQSRNDALALKVENLRAKRPLPSLVGQSQDAASSLADQYGWTVSVTQQGSDKPAGTILSQSPAAGTVMRYGAKFSIVVAKALPPGWKDLKVWSGSGTMKTELVDIPDGQVRVVFSFTGDFNDVITLMQPPDEWVDLLVNDIGPKSGSTRLYYTGKYFFDIEGGRWTVTLQVWK